MQKIECIKHNTRTTELGFQAGASYTGSESPKDLNSSRVICSVKPLHKVVIFFIEFGLHLLSDHNLVQNPANTYEFCFFGLYLISGQKLAEIPGKTFFFGCSPFFRWNTIVTISLRNL